MKTCPACNTRMEDSQEICPSCSVPYATAVLDDLRRSAAAAAETSAATEAAAAEDAELLLDHLAEILRPIDSAALPATGESLRKLLVPMGGLAVIFFNVAGAISGGNIFYIIAFVLVLALIPSVVALLRKRPPVGRGEAILLAAATLFAEESTKMRKRFGNEGDAAQRIDALQRHLNEVMTRHNKAARRNCRNLWIGFGVLLLLASGGVAALAVRNHTAREAEAAYASLPEWIRLRDAYLAAPDDTDKEGRAAVVRAMTEADEAAEAEEFFFSHCEGLVGDTECALMIVECHRRRQAPDALRAFTGKVSLRYNSDTKKIRSIKQ